MAGLDDDRSGTIVVLVHGTFARSAEWTRPTSNLYRGLLDTIPGKQSITAFAWSGRNSPAARFNAALQLRAELHRLATKHPGWAIVVIGHSHGGTVALRAVDCDELRPLAAVVCLSTPFLQAFPKNLPKGVLTQLRGALAGVLAIMLDPVLPSGHFMHIPRLVLPWIPYITGYAYVAIFMAIYLGVYSLLTAFSAKADKVASQVIHATELSPADVLLLRVAGDEASSWISVFQVLSWISSKISRVYATIGSQFNNGLLRISECLHSRVNKVSNTALLDERPIYLSLNEPTGMTKPFGSDDAGDSPLPPYTKTMGVVAIVLIEFALFFDIGSSPWTYLWRIVVGALGCILGLTALGAAAEGQFSPLGLLFLPILLPLMLVSACFGVLGILGFGLGTGLLGFFYEVSVEESPIGLWQIRLFPPTQTGLIYHSQIYENHDALSEMFKWITDRKSVSYKLLR
jgi:pimeloyl-ACP methyl ester carboxylesterase